MLGIKNRKSKTLSLTLLSNATKIFLTVTGLYKYYEKLQIDMKKYRPNLLPIAILSKEASQNFSSNIK